VLDVLGALGIILATMPVFVFVITPALIAYYFLLR
jgi:hypothetical protein